MAEIETFEEDPELTSEQRKVLGQVYRLILSWDCETPNSAESGSNEPQSSEEPIDNLTGKPTTANDVVEKALPQ